MKEKKHTDYITLKELAERWKCKYQTVWEFSHRKGSKAIKPRGRILISLKEIEMWESTHLVREEKPWR